MTSKNQIVTFCPPLRYFPTQPRDQSKCELVECPKCQKSMWLSAKKKAMLEDGARAGHQTIVECYVCGLERADNNPDSIANHTMITL